MSPKELHLVMERYGIKPNEDGSASMVVNGQEVVMHGDSPFDACEGLAEMAIGREECARAGHLTPEGLERVLAFICPRCGEPVVADA